MANQTIPGLSTIASPGETALLWVSDPAATPQDRSVLVGMVGFFVDSLSGSKTYAAISKNLRIIESAAGTIDITAGATVAGIRVDIVNKYAAGITLAVTTGAATVTMLLGSLSLEWDGTQWHKIGGMALSLILTTGTAATWITPWAGVYKTTVTRSRRQRADPTGALPNSTAGGGAGGGTAIAWLNESSGVLLLPILFLHNSDKLLSPMEQGLLLE